MILSIIVLIFCFIMTLIMYACMLKLDEIEKHDYAVRMRWEKESEPPEWADPEKWHESENAPIFHVGYDSDQMGREK